MSTLPPRWRQQEWKGCCMAKVFHLSMPLFVLLPDSQFLRWSHSSCGQTSSVNSMATMGLAHVNKAECAFTSIHAISVYIACGHIMCWTSVQYPHRLCATGLLQLEPVCCSYTILLPVVWGCAMVSHILMTVMSMQLLHVAHVQSLRLAPQCHAFRL